ncbi:malonate decarboxylase subunit delta [Xenorhabdus sp. IM139775]|uniref:malonate decarboxylase subunit delta n=1 Tax=Xenorhabdus sp. IM139775 TaxID=3025876 RepID=UPI002359C5B4|nr:malonate decarboxylase subunit delta [Xenorhabdus sp. IM139775]MDC9592756.1 malonate decarboxylase subunit delta [Xenorhabdus sp. IM139775]
MERIELQYPAKERLADKALAGVVGSGDMEALFEPTSDDVLSVIIKTSVDGHKQQWMHLFERLSMQRALPSGRLEINDFGATPGVVRLRIEQVFEEANHA